MIKTGIPISYDYEYCKKVLPRIYEHSDEIVLTLDKDRLTWSGNKIHIPDTFLYWVESFDKQYKIKIYEDSFYKSSLTAMENGTRQRNMMGEFMKPGGWHVLLDSDEYFLDFERFVNFLNSKNEYLVEPNKTPIQILVLWITLFKKVKNGYLYIKNSYVPIEIATNLPKYSYARVTNHRKRIYSKFFMLHESWSRSEKEILQKTSNWGAKDRIDTKAFYEFWKSIDEKNYRDIKNFHRTDPGKWKSLEFVKEKEIYNIKVKIGNWRFFLVKLKGNIYSFLTKNLNDQNLNRLRRIYRSLFFNSSIKHLWR